MLILYSSFFYFLKHVNEKQNTSTKKNEKTENTSAPSTSIIASLLRSTMSNVNYFLMRCDVKQTRSLSLSAFVERQATPPYPLHHTQPRMK